VITAWLVLLFVVSLATPAVGATPDPPRVIHVTPTGDGSRDGSGWSDAAALLQLPVLLSRAAPGTTVALRADLGQYHVTRPILIGSGGTVDRPIIVTGVDGSGRPMKAEIVGTRSEPYDPQGVRGTEVFRLVSGANHLRFQHLSFRNQGNGCFQIGADIRDLRIENVSARNVRRFIENFAARPARSATVEGLVVRNTDVRGYSKGAIRLQYDTRNVLLEDVTGDSERQDGDNFAMGVALQGTVHDVVLRRVTMRNSHDTLHKYWNGDGFTTESDVFRVRFEDTMATGNTDAGYDLKSRDTVLERAAAEDNKHNFKFWGRRIVLLDCIAKNPHIRGGTGVQDQFEILEGADVSITGCHVEDADPGTVVFHVDGNASARVENTTVSKHPDAKMSLIKEGGTLVVD